MDLTKDKYIILELIPTSLNKDKGLIVQLSALKLEGLTLIDRFDCRLSEDLIPFKQMLEMISYDKEAFRYLNSKDEIINEFKKWSDNIPVMIIDNIYTENYLSDIDNEIHSILPYLNLEYSDDVIERIISKYDLEPSNYIVDLIYEALIKEL